MQQTLPQMRRRLAAQRLKKRCPVRLHREPVCDYKTFAKNFSAFEQKQKNKDSSECEIKTKQ
jgi:hypothetical protein